MDKRFDFIDFIDIIRVLRGDNGCPWDKVQTHKSLREAMLEEAYEAVWAIDREDTENLKEELGDVLMQVVFHGGIAEDNGEFTLDDIIDGISRKMIARHTHIFAEDQADTEADVNILWEKNKKKEKGYKTLAEELDHIPKALPALMRARKIIKKSGASGEKIIEEMVLNSKSGENIEIDHKEREKDASLDERIRILAHLTNNISALLLSEGLGEDEKLNVFGDLLFLLTKISLFLDINPEFALTNSSEKFITKLRYI